MREIKFRAWDAGHKKMWSPEEMGTDELTINPDGRGFVNVHSTSTKLSQYMPHLIPLQYTGLKDKNGRDVYEGDIVKHDYPFESQEIVKYDNDYAGFEPFRDGETGWDSDSTEVLGNIYENPELCAAPAAGGGE